MSLDNPIRYPDVTSSEVMTKRSWWLVLLGFFIPGAPQALAGNRRLGRFGLATTLVLWFILVAAAVTFFVSRQTLIGLFTMSWSLLIIQVLLVFYGIVWLFLTLNTLTLVRFVKVRPQARFFVAGTAILALMLSTGGTAYAAYIANASRNLVGTVFAEGKHEDPINGRYNILLIGADAGEDREGVRPDSMTVVSVDAETGQAVMVGVPRDIVDVPIPASSPLRELYPNGVCDTEPAVCKANGMFNYVNAYYGELFPDSEKNGSSPGIDATKDVVEGVTGIEIQYYVLVDMQGFAQMIDALGGVKVDVTERVPLVAQGFEGEVPEWIEPGEQTMDGQRALWYARSRYESTDWDRMERQRQIQKAVIAQFTPANVLSKFQGIASASSQLIQTDIPESMLSYFVELAMKTKELPITDVELTPPLIDPDYPDYDFIHEHIAQILSPPKETDAPAG